jgi:hypothetical protein
MSSIPDTVLAYDLDAVAHVETWLGLKTVRA